MTREVISSTKKERQREASRKYRINHPEKIRENNHKCYATHREKYCADARKRRIENPEKHREVNRKFRLTHLKERYEYTRKYQKNHPEKVREYAHKHRLNNPEKIQESNHKYSTENREKINKYHRNRRCNDYEYRLVSNCRARIISVLKGVSKSASTMELLGCDMKTLWEHLESQFLPSMTRENHGMFGWHIDHIKPCNAFDLTDPKQQKECFHYTNLQPLWAEDNWKKKTKLIV